MKTEELIHLYFNKVKEKSDWQTLIDDEIKFESPTLATTGKDAYIVAASRFFQMAETLEIKHLLIAGEQICAWVNYHLRLKSGNEYNCLVSEYLEVRNNKIITSSILFDTLALKTFTSQAQKRG